MPISKSKLHKLNKEQLIDELERLQSQQAGKKSGKEVYLRQELEVHQVELEMQNRELQANQYELEVTRDKYADLYDFAPVGYLTLDEKGVIREINLIATRLLGNTRTQLLDKPFSAYLAPGNSKVFFDSLHNQLGGSEESSVEVDVKGQDGQVLTMLLQMASSHFNGGWAVRVAMLDISERKQTERALLEERDKAQRYLDTVEAMILALDIEGRITLINRKGCEILGYKEEELLGKNWFATCIPQPERDELIDKVFKRFLQGDFSSVEYFENPVIDKHGKQHLIAWHNNVLLDKDGNIAGDLSAGEDITERRLYEEKTRNLLQQNRELTQYLFQIQEEERQNIARELHDEFGQWLTAIQLDAQNITNRLEHPSAEIEASVASITQSAKQIHEGLRGIIHSLRPALMDELGLTDSLRELINQWAEYNPDIKCELSLDDELDSLGKKLGITIYRIVQEALTNVTKHAGAHQVAIQLRRIPAKSADKPDRLVLSIDDDGKGMRTRARGQGMGIPGMRERVLSAEGKFTVKSSKTGVKNKGTRIEAKFSLNSEYDKQA